MNHSNDNRNMSDEWLERAKTEDAARKAKVDTYYVYKNFILNNHVVCVSPLSQAAEGTATGALKEFMEKSGGGSAPTPASAHPEKPKVAMSFGGSDKCYACAKSVYKADPQTNIDGRVLHSVSSTFICK
jgi:hypothetical protein